jgi:hypothetical protein
MSEVKLENDVQWDGERLLVWAVTSTSRVLCEIPRDTIHRVPLYSDAITREIARDKYEIVDRLRLHVIAKVANYKGTSVRLHPTDLAGI